MLGNGSSILSQLSGLRLSDGSVASVRVLSNTPPALPEAVSLLPFSTAPVVSSTAGIVSNNNNNGQGNSNKGASAVGSSATASPSMRADISRFLSANAIQGSPISEQLYSNSTPPSEKKRGTDLVADLALKLAAAHIPPSSTTSLENKGDSNAKGSSVGGNNSKVSSSIVVPKPRSCSTAVAACSTSGEVVDPSVLAFIKSKVGGSAGPLQVAEEKELRTAVANTTMSSTSTATNANPSPKFEASPPKCTPTLTQKVKQVSAGGSMGGTSAEEKQKAIAANRFLVETLGGGVIDNMNVSEPVIRTAPSLPEGGRYIIVGDVHGCLEQLRALVDKVGYMKGKDCLIIIGDYVNKGPDSLGVVRACQDWGAIGVLGNHDWTLLDMCSRMRRKAFSADNLRDPVKRLAGQFSLSCEYYLRMLPHILRIPSYNVLLVHAGLNIQHPVEKQSITEIMNLRKLHKVSVPNPKSGCHRDITRYNAITDGKSQQGEPWASLWKGPETVIFGHDAYTGFQSHPFACGIDTGCVYGDPLTCVVYGPESPQGEFHRVPGLPRQTNELLGMPPPNSNIYEQAESALHQIIRPVTRSTPGAASPMMSVRPSFATTPISFGSPKFGSLGESPVFPSQQVAHTPLAEVNARARHVADVSANEVQKATLLALSAAAELSAVGTLLAIPQYECALDAMQGEEVEDKTAQQSFWTPFVQNILQAAATKPPSVSMIDAEEDAVLFALGVCDDMESVCGAVQKELAELEAVGIPRCSRSVEKYISLLRW